MPNNTTNPTVWVSNSRTRTTEMYPVVAQFRFQIQNVGLKVWNFMILFYCSQFVAFEN